MDQARVQMIITDCPLPAGNDVIVRDIDDCTQVFVNRGSLLADPEAMLHQLASLSEFKRRHPTAA